MVSTSVRDAVLSGVPLFSLVPSEVVEWLHGYSLLSSLCFILIIILIIIIIMGAYPHRISYSSNEEHLIDIPSGGFHQLNNK